MSQQSLSIQQAPRDGFDYPFLSSGNELSPVILDLFIEHPADAKLPLRVDTATGLDGATPGLVILDRDDNVIFDTDACVYLGNNAWGTYYTTHGWESTDNRILRMSVGSEHQSDALPLYTDQRAIIDPRTYMPVLPGVKRLQVYDQGTKIGDYNLESDPVRFRAGYNTHFDTTEAPVRKYNGQVVGGSVTVAVIPGQGLGQYPGCDDEGTRLVRSLNQSPPMPGGRFTATGDSCMRLEPQVTFDSAGVATIVHGSVLVYDDCEACCDCDDYLRPYYSIQRVKRVATPVVNVLDDIRNRYIEEFEYLQDAIDCLIDQELRLSVQVTGSCEITIHAGIFNGTATQQTQVGLDIRIMWQNHAGQWYMADPTFVPETASYIRNGNVIRQVQLEEVSRGRLRTWIECVEQDELHQAAMRIGIAGSRAVKVCLGFPDSSPSDYICRDVFSNCPLS